VPAAAAALQTIKDDAAAPALQREFLLKVQGKGNRGR
jgi:hypothetical protein